MSRLVVQAGFGYPVTTAPQDITWTDLTGRVNTADGGPGVHIDRGASDEIAETETGTATLTLDNSDGALTAGFAASPYYPNVKKNTPIRILLVTAETNLVTNGSFEDDADGWEEHSELPPAAAVVDATRAHHGTQAYRVTWEAAGDPGIVQSVLYGLTIGEEHTASAWVWVPAGSPPVRLQLDDGATAGTASATTGAWEQITVTWTATEAVHVLQATATTVGGEVWLDEVQVEEGSAPSAFSADFARVHERFYGMVNQWPKRRRGLMAETTVICSDITKWLSGMPELQSMLAEEVLLTGPLAYYPMGEPFDSASAGDLSGTTAGSLVVTQSGSGGTLEFGEDGGPSDGQTVPVFAPASSSAGLYLASDLGHDYETLSSSNFLFFECWFSTGTRGRVLFGLASDTGEYQMVLSLDAATGQLLIEWTTTGGGTSTFSSVTAATGDLADGAVHHLVYDEAWENVYIDGVAYSVAGVALMFDLRHLTVGAYGGVDLWQGAIAHLALYAPDDIDAADLVAHYTTGTTEHIGESADERMARIARYVDLDVEAVGGDFDALASQRALGSTPLVHMREIEATESGKLFAARGGPELVFQSRDVRYNPTAAASLAYADLETDEVELSDDDQKMVNTVIASRPGGATQRVIDTEARAAYGPYERRLELLKSTDAGALDAGNWLVSRYADPPPEYRQIPVEASTLPLATYRALLDADVSTVLEVTDLPDDDPAPTATVVVEGYAETIHHNQHHLSYRTSRADTDSVWVLDDPTYAQLGITTRLAY